MFIKRVNRHIADVFFGNGWGNAVRFDITNNRILFSTIDVDNSMLKGIRSYFKKVS